MELDYKKTFWSDAAKAGFVLGILSALLMVAAWVFKLDGSLSWLNNILSYVIIIGCLYVFGKKRAAVHGDAGFSYGQSLSFIIASMLFAGVIIGLATYLMQSVVAPEYYQELRDVAVMNAGIDVDSAEYEMSMSMVDKMMNNPVTMVFAGMIGMIFSGFFIGLIISIFVKKQPNIFAENK